MAVRYQLDSTATWLVCHPELSSAFDLIHIPSKAFSRVEPDPKRAVRAVTLQGQSQVAALVFDDAPCVVVVFDCLATATMSLLAQKHQITQIRVVRELALLLMKAGYVQVVDLVTNSVLSVVSGVSRLITSSCISNLNLLRESGPKLQVVGLPGKETKAEAEGEWESKKMSESGQFLFLSKGSMVKVIYSKTDIRSGEVIFQSDVEQVVVGQKGHFLVLLVNKLGTKIVKLEARLKKDCVVVSLRSQAQIGTIPSLFIWAVQNGLSYLSLERTVESICFTA